jgi:hypothetical protein
MTGRSVRIVAALLVAAFALLTALLPGHLVATAHADGDPASDVLLGENVFYPYTPPVSAALQKTLNAETTSASRAHFPIKVALIASPVDLGVIPGLFGKPQKYADFLDQEISFQTKQPLLVVMSNGYGVQGLSPTAQTAVASLKKPAGSHSNDLAQAAVTAVAKLADAAGHPVKAAPGNSSAGGSGGSTTVIVLALALAAVATAAALLVLRRRQAAAR